MAAMPPGVGGRGRTREGSPQTHSMPTCYHIFLSSPYGPAIPSSSLSSKPFPSTGISPPVRRGDGPVSPALTAPQPSYPPPNPCYRHGTCPLLPRSTRLPQPTSSPSPLRPLTARSSQIEHGTPYPIKEVVSYTAYYNPSAS